LGGPPRAVPTGRVVLDNPTAAGCLATITQSLWDKNSGSDTSKRPDPLFIGKNAA